jgi:hypothetical protein
MEVIAVESQLGDGSAGTIITVKSFSGSNYKGMDKQLTFKLSKQFAVFCFVAVRCFYRVHGLLCLFGLGEVLISNEGDDADITKYSCDDLSAMADLHEAKVLQLLKYRYLGHQSTGSSPQCQPYTYCGALCISLNPYKRLPALYTLDHNTIARVRSRSHSPHLFVLADRAYTSMSEGGGDQAILVSGESGAGKTEVSMILCAILLGYFAVTFSPPISRQANI